MRILLHDFAAYAFSLELAREMARRGNTVCYVYFPSATQAMSNAEARPSDPVALHICPLGADLPYSRFSLGKRLFQEIAFGRLLSSFIKKWQPDVVISANAPLEVQRRAATAAKACHARFIFWLQDLLGAGARDVLSRRLGPLGALVASRFERMEVAIARMSNKVVCISEDFLPVLERWGVPRECTSVIQNWAPKDDIIPRPKDNPWSRKNGLHEKKVLLYAGRLGFKQNPRVLLDLAEANREQSDTSIVVISSGVGADWLSEKKIERGLQSLQIMPFQPYKCLPNMLATADILLCTIEVTASRYCVPSKILSYLAAGRAILASMPSNNLNARLIERIGAGVVVDPFDPDGFVQAGSLLLGNDTERIACAERARAYAEMAFDIENIVDAFLEAIVG